MDRDIDHGPKRPVASLDKGCRTATARSSRDDHLLLLDSEKGKVAVIRAVPTGYTRRVRAKAAIWG